MRLIRFLMNHAPRMLLLATAAGLVGGAASTGLLVVIRAGLERTGSQPQSMFLAFLGFAGLGMISRSASALLLATIGESAMLELRLRICRQILGVPLERLESAGIPRLLAVVTDDILNVLNAVANIPLTCINIAAVFTCLAFMAWQSWLLFLVVAGLILLLLFTAQLPFMAAAKHFALARKQHNSVMAHLRGLVSGIKELKVNRTRKLEFVAELEGSATLYKVHSLRAMRIAVLGATWAEMLSFLTIGLLVFVAPRFIAVPNATLMTFVLIMLYLMEPIEFLQHQAPQFAKGVVALASIESLGLALCKTGKEKDDAISVPPSTFERIEFKDVVFSYGPDDENHRFVLGPIQFSVHAGELVFITGGNGSGKTTVAKLLLGLYRQDTGEIHLDGRAVSDDEREDYSQLFSAVFADFFLFDKVMGATRRGRDERANYYLQRLQLGHKLTIANGVFSTSDLSQGQRKRLALLTAYLEDRPIFVFDEWAADQDPAFKALFYRELLPELRASGKTIFVISHDERYYGVADRIIHLEEGRIVNDLEQPRGTGSFAPTLMASTAAGAAGAQLP